MLFSDNTSQIHPQVLQAIVDANDPRFLASYGEDRFSQLVKTRLSAAFGAGQVSFCATGTGANVVALAALGAAGSRVLSSSIAHLKNDEAGAPERALSCQIVGIETSSGLLDPDQLYRAASRDAHAPRLAVVSITQATEHGRVYSLAEIADLADAAHDLGAALHVDGARLANAAASRMADGWMDLFDHGVDALSLSGTKNGALSAEAVLVAPGTITALDLDRLARSCGQLASKSRFIAAQFSALFDDELWLKNAANANAMAQRLALALDARGIELAHPTEANEVFALLCPEVSNGLNSLGDQLACPWDESGTTRFVCSWSTTEEDLVYILDALDHLL